MLVFALVAQDVLSQNKHQVHTRICVNASVDDISQVKNEAVVEDERKCKIFFFQGRVDKSLLSRLRVERMCLYKSLGV